MGLTQTVNVFLLNLIFLIFHSVPFTYKMHGGTIKNLRKLAEKKQLTLGFINVQSL